MSVEEAQAQLAAALTEWHAATREWQEAKVAWNTAGERYNLSTSALALAYRDVEKASAPQLDLSAS